MPLSRLIESVRADRCDRGRPATARQSRLGAGCATRDAERSPARYRNRPSVPRALQVPLHGALLAERSRSHHAVLQRRAQEGLRLYADWREPDFRYLAQPETVRDPEATDPRDAGEPDHRRTRPRQSARALQL